MSDQHNGPYDDDTCHFCHKSAKKGVEYTAGYQRAEDAKPSGPFFDACEACARKPYSTPRQFLEKA